MARNSSSWALGMIALLSMLYWRTRKPELAKCSSNIPTFRLRPLRELERLEEVVEAMEDGSVAKATLLIPHPYTLEDAEFFYNLFKDSEELLYIEIDGHFAGAIGAHPQEATGRNHILSIGYYLSPKYRGMGVMRKALDECIRRLKVKQVEQKKILLEACIFSWNKSSARVLEANGFDHAGYMSAYYQKNGEYLDSIRYIRWL